MNRLSHLDDQGRARMVDIGGKPDTARHAVAGGRLRTTPEVLALLRTDSLPKADVLATARLAGIAGAKKTSELIPLCHQVALSVVEIRFEITDTAVAIEATAKTTGPTGVEMEALTAVAIAGLTLHDMVKAVDPAAVLEEVRLLAKEGGKRGRWTRADAEPLEVPQAESHSAVVLVASTGAAAGTRTDTTGPVLVDWLAGQGFSVRGPLVYPDAEISAGITEALRSRPALVISTGGTGAAPTDRTPEATRAVLDRELPGIAEAVRNRGTAATPLAALSRGVAGLAGSTVIVNLPGSPGGVRDGIAALEPLLEHLLAQVVGGGSHAD